MQSCNETKLAGNTVNKKMKETIFKLLGMRSSAERQLEKAIQTVTGLQPKNLVLYRLALLHRSSGTAQYSNERLEFLGDAVLSLIVGEYLFKKYPLKEEGFLTEIRSRIVNRLSLSSLAKKIGIDTLLRYNKSSLQRGHKFIYGNALEALIGAVYVDRGYPRCRQFVLEQLLHLHMDLETLIKTDTNYKSQLVTWANRNRKSIQFEIISEQRDAQASGFTAQVTMEHQVVGQGQGTNKKQAEQQAALAALSKLTSLET